MSVRTLVQGLRDHSQADANCQLHVVCDTTAELTTSLAQRPGDTAVTLDNGGRWRWNGTAWVEQGDAVFTSVLVNNTAKDIHTFALPTAQTVVSGVLEISFYVQTATPAIQFNTIIVPFECKNVGGTVTGFIGNTVGVDYMSAPDVSGSTNAITLAINVSGTNASIRVTSNSGLTPTVQRCSYRIRRLEGLSIAGTAVA